MDASFKTCMFGGFDRQDVVTFIEKTAEEHRTALEVLQAENDTLRRERDDAVAENDTLRLLAEEDARLRDDNTHLEQQVQDLQQQLTAVQAENDALRGPAGEYQSLKEHVADIEISAHRRTEEFRARAMERLGQCIAQRAPVVQPAPQHLSEHEYRVGRAIARCPGGGGQRRLRRL